VGGGSCEHGNESSGSIKGWKLLDQLSDYRLSGTAEQHAAGIEFESGLAGFSWSSSVYPGKI
jgi:hypothetical protein